MSRPTIYFVTNSNFCIPAKCSFNGRNRIGHRVIEMKMADAMGGYVSRHGVSIKRAVVGNLLLSLNGVRSLNCVDTLVLTVLQ